MSAAPPVSIGLPVYNGERFLAQTLADLLGQTYGDFELVVCDNASTDATPEILAEAAATDPRVVVVRNDANLGALPNTNLAFARSRGPRYVLASHDDRHAPDFLARLVGALDADPEAVLAYGASTLIGDDDRPFRFVPERDAYVDADGRPYGYDRRLQKTLSEDPVERFRSVLRATDTNAAIYGLFRREALERIGPHQIHGSDRLVVAHAALLGRFAFVDAPLFGYRIHAESTLHLTREEWIERDTGNDTSPSWADGAHVLRRYLTAVRNASLTFGQRLRAERAVLGYAARLDVMRRMMIPGPDNMWGWGCTPGEDESGERAPRMNARQDFDLAEWAWLKKMPDKDSGVG
ncbi:MAG: glycosyltransferase [Bacteroidota bacterium]